jgi:PadR family transcriptional regulator, regulatory protein AphA
MPTEAAILGLLAKGERSGYDLVKAVSRSVGYFWTPANSQLYAVLHRLVETGLASSRTIKQSSRPDKQLYRITPAGRAALQEWINAPTAPEPSRNALLLQLFFGEHGDPRALLEHVRARRRELEELQAELTRIDAEPPRREDADFYPGLTRSYGHAYARALTKWARSVEADLARRLEQ